MRLPGGGEARRTDYVGTVWFDGKPEVSGLMLRRPANAPRGIRVPNMQAAFFGPDSMAYSRTALGDARLSISVTLCGTGETSAITEAAGGVHRRPLGRADVDPGAHLRPSQLAGRTSATGSSL